jgi:hypothetical protein
MKWIVILAVICSVQGQVCPAFSTVLESHGTPSTYFPETVWQYGSLESSPYEEDPAAGNCMSRSPRIISTHGALLGKLPAIALEDEVALPRISSPGSWLVNGLAIERTTPMPVRVPSEASCASPRAGSRNSTLGSGVIPQNGLASALDCKANIRLSEKRMILAWPNSPTGSWRQPATSSRLHGYLSRRVSGRISGDQSRFSFPYASHGDKTFRRDSFAVSGLLGRGPARSAKQSESRAIFFDSSTAPSWGRYMGDDSKPLYATQSLDSKPMPREAGMSTVVPLVCEQSYSEEDSREALIRGTIPRHFPADLLAKSGLVRPYADDLFISNRYHDETSHRPTSEFWGTDRSHRVQGSILVDF